MDSSSTQMVRQFNRYYTGRIGALSDHYLGQRRPLAKARLLFEIGLAGRPVRELRADLALDSGYLARLLRSLERQGLVVVDPDPVDRRARVATLTRRGARELDDLEKRSDAASRALLSPVPEAERSQVLDAMATIYRALRRAEVTVETDLPTSPDVTRCLAAYAAELNTRFPEGYRASDLLSAKELRAGGGICMIARDRRRAIGCGVLHRLDDSIGEIKHLWVSPDARGLGVARLLLTALEGAALGQGFSLVRLDTHEVLVEAIALYRRSGFSEVPRYGANPHAHVWFEKVLAPKASTPAITYDPPVAYDELLAHRIRELMASQPEVREKKMFGGLAFLVNGNMAIAASGQGGILVRVDPRESDRLLRTTDAEVAVMRGRPMSGWLRLAPDQVRTKAQLRSWVLRGAKYAASLPAKP